MTGRRSPPLNRQSVAYLKQRLLFYSLSVLQLVILPTCARENEPSNRGFKIRETKGEDPMLLMITGIVLLTIFLLFSSVSCYVIAADGSTSPPKRFEENQVKQQKTVTPTVSTTQTPTPTQPSDC